ncbi:BtpA/SgcQ family protein [Geoglobus acetivorans]|uniref:Photosystem I assembly BtpA n=1 Tax=Geoglobus acetivorans TaxID=565033 RepID=A0A0A7GBK1_GEOAI|nr:hypothetical protein GACE_0347 [Geoglobus acetivorans]
MIIGVLHLKPLPGSPRYSDFNEVIEHAVRNAGKLEEGGVSAILVENYGDFPYLREVGKETVACMTAVIKEIQKEIHIPVGVNVLRNDAIASCAIAKAAGAEFIRVNQAAFPSAAPEGFLEPAAGTLARYMRMIDLKARVYADVNVKHAVHFAAIEDYLENIERTFADAVIVTGKKTGMAPDLAELKKIKEAVEIPVFAGSGINTSNIARFAEYADGFIVGSYFKAGDEIEVEKVEKLCRLARSLKR